MRRSAPPPVVALFAMVGWAGLPTALAAQAEPPVGPPADWGPTAIDYTNVP